MENQALRRWIKLQLDGRSDELTDGLPITDPTQLGAEYRYRVGIIHGIALVKQFLKDEEDKNLQEEINSQDA